MLEHLKKNWKTYALLLGGAAGTYFGVPAPVAQEALTKVYEILAPLFLGS